MSFALFAIASFLFLFGSLWMLLFTPRERRGPIYAYVTGSLFLLAGNFIAAGWI